MTNCFDTIDCGAAMIHVILEFIPSINQSISQSYFVTWPKKQGNYFKDQVSLHSSANILFWLLMLQCLMHLEDQLQSIYLKSKLLAEYIKVHRRVFSHELASLHEYVTQSSFVDKTVC